MGSIRHRHFISSLRPVSRLETVHVLLGRGAGGICWEASVVNNDWQIKQKETLTKMYTDQSFQVFYANVTGKGEGLIGERTLPRKRHTPDKLKVGVLTYPFLSKIT